MSGLYEPFRKVLAVLTGIVGIELFANYPSWVTLVVAIFLSAIALLLLVWTGYSNFDQ